VSRVPEIASRSLTETDLDGFELQPEQLRVHLRARLGITRGGIRFENAELLELGFFEVGVHQIYAVYALRQPRPGIGDLLRARADGAPQVLLIPSPECDGIELAHVRLESALPTKRGFIRQAVCACALDGSVPAPYTAPDEARLIVDTQAGKVWVDGIEIAGLPPDSHAFKFIELLARHSSMSAIDIVARISPGRQDDTTAARQAKRRAKELIINAIVESGWRNFDEDLFPSSGAGLYRCTALAHVR
jgi:hypothetical protein